MFSLEGRQAGGRRLPVEHPGGCAGRQGCSKGLGWWGGLGGPGTPGSKVQGSCLGNAGLTMAPTVRVMGRLSASPGSVETSSLFFSFSNSWFFLVL